MNVSLRDILNLVTRHGYFYHALRIATEFGLYHSRFAPIQNSKCKNQNLGTRAVRFHGLLGFDF